MQVRFGFALDEVGDVSNFAGFLLRVASVHASSVRLETAPTNLKVKIDTL